MDKKITFQEAFEAFLEKYPGDLAQEVAFGQSIKLLTEAYLNLERIVMTPKPTIGRIVLYHKYGTAGGEHPAEPSPAVITKVFENNEVMLFVMNPNGLYFNRTPYSETPKGGHWSWPVRD